MLSSLKIITAIALVLALWDWPYDYYTLLRVLTFVTGGWGAITYYNQGNTPFALVFVFIAILFNPIAPIHLERSTWAFIDLMAAALLLYSLSVDEKK